MCNPELEVRKGKYFAGGFYYIYVYIYNTYIHHTKFGKSKVIFFSVVQINELVKCKKKSSFCVVLMSFPNLLALLKTVYCFVYSVKGRKKTWKNFAFISRVFLNCLSRVELNERNWSQIKSIWTFDILLMKMGIFLLYPTIYKRKLIQGKNMQLGYSLM